MFFGISGYAQEGTVTSLIVDSAMEFEEVFDGLNPNCPYDILIDQVIVDVLYYSMDGMVHKGQIVVNEQLVGDIREIFKVAYIEQFPFESVIPISRFHWNDEASMEANNTSAFNYREVTKGKKLSKHAYGFAIDINPRLNPYIKGKVTLPSNAAYNPWERGTFTNDHVLVKTFLRLGWEWGGYWKSLKDYQHFEKVPKE